MSTSNQPAFLSALAGSYRRSLRDDILPFWLRHGWDRRHGGFQTALGRDGELIESDKSVWFQGRAAWTYASASLAFPEAAERAEWQQAAASAIAFSDRHCYDADGRMFFRVTAEGQPVIKRRYAFSECFAAIAKAAYARASGDAASLADAVRLFDYIERYRTSPELQNPKFNPATRPGAGLSFPMIQINVAQELRLAARALDPGNTALAARCSAIIADRIGDIGRLFVKPELKAVLEQTGPNGEVQADHFEGRLLNPGHAIEAAWFILREVDEQRRAGGADPAVLESWQELGLTMLDWMLEWGWDQEYGGLWYFRDVLGKPVAEYWHSMKFWWPHNEAILACLYGMLLGGHARYRPWFDKLHAWTWDHFPDPGHGEWFGYLNRDGSVSTELKGNLYKGPFHIPRMLLLAPELMERVAAGEGPA